MAEIKHWQGLTGAGFAWAIDQTMMQHNGVAVLVMPSNQHAEQIAAEIEFFRSSNYSIDIFPDWETLPYDQFSPHQDIISDRISILNRLPHMQQGLVIIAIPTLMHVLAPKSYLVAHSLHLSTGQRIQVDHFRSQLIESGYRMVSQVMEHGECAMRGSIIDIFPMGNALPYRIDLFDDEIDTIRTFDPDNQRSIEKISTIDCLPAREFPLNDSSITLFRQQWREQFSGNPTNCHIYNDVSDGIASSGIEYYLPFFFQQTATFFDYCPKNTLFIRYQQLTKSGEEFWQEVQHRFEQRRYDISLPILHPQQLFIPVDQLFGQLKSFQQVELQADTTDKANPDIAIDRKAQTPLKKLQQFLQQTEQRILFCAESPGRREVLRELLADIDCKPTTVESWSDFLNADIRCGLTHGLLIEGLDLAQHNIQIIVENQIFDQQLIPQRKRKSRALDPDVMIRDLTELRIGSPVVHLDHGIGRYLGLKKLNINNTNNEYIELEYAGGDKIYVPVTALHMLSRYTGINVDTAPLHRLGNEQWQKDKRAAAEKISDVAAELLDIYAQREARQGHQYQIAATDYQRFATDFPFEETVDQQRAIKQVIQDMTSKQPMDRLVCGDVGFGKTEVAMRAAFVAVNNQKQVAILVPTTLLAGQHYDNFIERFAEFPVNIAILSRFTAKKDQEKAIAGIANGSVDIVIGTHKLIQKNIQFKQLGLVIIDEEHRFGVKQKEFLKSLRTEVDILSLTATPIPRTLNMAMNKLRDISLIATPPARRLSIKTFWQQQNDTVIREAILREILRGGQVFYLHNKVETIERVTHDITELVPEAKVKLAHGQMRERELENIMSDFYHRRFNVLVCTTIIETGIDIPTANTIIIDRADKFGLAQLHQIRGRVGRSHHQAYAYLITPDQKAMTKDAVKRLEAITALEDLGSGFTLATHDLEIRGAGELLGEEQSGNIQALGFTLYMELLERAVKALESGKIPELTQPINNGPEINCYVSALIPDDYIADVHLRLTLYKRIANADNQTQLDDIQVEMIDRFGLLPIETKRLFKITQLKFNAQKIGATKVDFNQRKGLIEFSENANVDAEKIILLMQTKPKTYRMDGPTKLRITETIDNGDDRIEFIAQLVGSLHVK